MGIIPIIKELISITSKTAAHEVLEILFLAKE